MNFIDLSLNIS